MDAARSDGSEPGGAMCRKCTVAEETKPPVDAVAWRIFWKNRERVMLLIQEARDNATAVLS
ncbi:uncharacterized protein N7487_004587 [Penicillium crustosum]|uniref:uncharacterized protein n=1 Tax=Penicillium crustosum TaxID=36656 RepID=UPI00238377F8|nr:uncharacterized protein N7487_004587 [Penicillium crustosum]KAJ5410228.1 hypothetical protein N7487_004587 [Penicillium crustosum]